MVQRMHQKLIMCRGCTNCRTSRACRRLHVLPRRTTSTCRPAAAGTCSRKCNGRGPTRSLHNVFVGPVRVDAEEAMQPHQLLEIPALAEHVKNISWIFPTSVVEQ